MENTIANQIYLLFIFIMTGIAIGTFFDIFRVLRKTFKTSDFITCVEDVIFWVTSGIFFLIVLFKFNNGQIRNYVILGILIGILLYMLTISKYFIRINVRIVNITKKVVTLPTKIISKFIKILFKPLSFIVINIKKSLYDFAKKLKKLSKKCCIKKDFKV